MLTANTKSGKRFCLGDDYSKDALLSLRSNEDFFCPLCGESVTLKLGDQRIFHFAHKRESNCRDYIENESFQHLEGKRQLYQWLIKQRIPSVLEYYDREIQQRPDIMFKYHGKKYALEYQCSSVPEKVFIKRTKTYLENEYIPLWILSSDNIHRKKRNIIALSNFHYLFLRVASLGNYYIPSYCPDKQLFHLVHSISSYSIKNAFIQNSFFSPKDMKIEGLLAPINKYQCNLFSWNKEIEYTKLNLTLYPSKLQNQFLNEVYNHHLNVSFLPLEIGLPVPHSFTIQTSPIIWQTYLFLDVLSHKNLNDIITIQEISGHFNKRKMRKEIITRRLPQLGQVNPLLAEIEYLQLLVKLGILTKKGTNTFQVQQKIVIPKSNREKEELSSLFFEKQYRIFSEI